MMDIDRLAICHTPTGKHRVVMAALLLGALVTLYYARSVSYGLIYDDVPLIEAQPRGGGVAALVRVFVEPHFPNLPYYRPVTRLTLVAQKMIHGDRPWAFHLVNALLAGCLAAVLFRILEAPPFALTAGSSLAAAALFSLHPAVSSVVYPVSSGRETLLPALLMFAALRVFFREGRGSRAAALFFFVLALFSKEQAVLFPLTLVLADALGLRRDSPGRDWRRWLSIYLPYLLPLAAYFAVRNRLFHWGEFILRAADSPSQVALSYLFSLQTVFAPFRELRYEPPVEVWLSPFRLAVALSGATLLAVAAVLQRRARGRQFVFWAGWFVVMQLATANLLSQEAAFEERYVFAAMYGVFAAAALTVQPFLDHRLRRAAVAAVALVLLGAYASAGPARGLVFSDSYHFYRGWQETNPGSSIAQTNYAIVLKARGNLAGAREHFARSLALRPSVEALVGLGQVEDLEGKPEWARRLYEEAVALNPTNVSARSYLAVSCILLGDYESAGSQLREALRLSPDDPMAVSNQGVLLASSGHPGEAVAWFEKASRLAPDNTRNLVNLGRAYAATGREDRAAEVWRNAEDMARVAGDERLGAELEGLLASLPAK
jgi:Flp pilus assembly protein TadD